MSDSTDVRALFVSYALGVISAEQLQALETAAPQGLGSAQ